MLKNLNKTADHIELELLPDSKWLWPIMLVSATVMMFIAWLALVTIFSLTDAPETEVIADFSNEVYQLEKGMK